MVNFNGLGGDVIDNNFSSVISVSPIVTYGEITVCHESWHTYVCACDKTVHKENSSQWHVLELIKG